MIEPSRKLSLLGLVAVLAISGCTSIAKGSTGDEHASAKPGNPDGQTAAVDLVDESLTIPLGSLDETSVDSRDVDLSSTASTVSAVDIYPVRVRIPAIDVESEIIDLGLNEDGTLEVPKDWDQTGWYTGRSVPGNMGPGVVVGHIDSRSGPAVFFRLRDLKVGNMVEIYRSDGTVALFRVSETVMVLKDDFPTDQVYGPTSEPTLRLITCGGDFDRSIESYKGNLIVYAEHILNFRPPQAPQPS